MMIKMTKISSAEIIKNLDIMYPDARCELNYTTDYELLIAVTLSAHSTDKTVNKVTDKLFAKYNIFTLAEADLKDLEAIIRPVGTYIRKAKFVKVIAKSLVRDYNGIVPSSRTYLENLPGVGHKTCNVVLSEIYNEPSIAVDTHVFRVSKRLGLTKEEDNLQITEKTLMAFFPKEKWNRLHKQLVLFGRYTCKAKNPVCSDCKFQNKCEWTKINHQKIATS